MLWLMFPPMKFQLMIALNLIILKDNNVYTTLINFFFFDKYTTLINGSTYFYFIGKLAKSLVTIDLLKNK